MTSTRCREPYCARICFFSRRSRKIPCSASTLVLRSWLFFQQVFLPLELQSLLQCGSRKRQQMHQGGRGGGGEGVGGGGRVLLPADGERQGQGVQIRAGGILSPDMSLFPRAVEAVEADPRLAAMRSRDPRRDTPSGLSRHTCHSLFSSLPLARTTGVPGGTEVPWPRSPFGGQCA